MNLINRTGDCGVNPIFVLTGDSGHVGCSAAGTEFCLPSAANNVSLLSINLALCAAMFYFPVEIFDAGNRIKGLRVYGPRERSGAKRIQTFKNGTFENLGGLEELHLEGFESVRVLESEVFRPLLRLRSLRLVAFGADHLTYLDLGVALTQLSGSLLEEIALDGIHSSSNNEKALNLDELFQISQVRITSLEFVNNDINIVTGRLSTSLPHLKSLTFTAYWVYAYAVLNFGIDAFFLLNQLESIHFAFVEPNAAATPPVHVVRWPPEPETICVKCRLDIPLLDYYLNLDPSENCYFNRTLTMSRRLRSVTVRGMDFFRVGRIADVCVEGNNSLEYLDLAGSTIAALAGTVRGLKRLRYLSLQGMGLAHISESLFREMPAVEVLLLSGNHLEESIREDVNGSLFKNLTLKTLDVSDCGLTVIPRTMFSSLDNLEFLNLSKNKIETVEVELSSCGNLSLLNLSDNSIRMMSAQMTDQLESLQGNDDKSRKPTIDLSRNPLSCLCNVTNFIVWLKSTEKVSFENIDEYTCLHPNATQVSVSRLNITELLSDCKAVTQLANITCPCDGLNYARLRQISLSLSGVYCTYDGKGFSYADLVSSANKTLKEYWWCQNVITRDNPFFTSPRFLVPVTVGLIALLILGTALVIMYRRRRYREEDFDWLLIDLEQPPPDEQRIDFEFDVFIYSHPDDSLWVRAALCRRLSHLSVTTQDDFVPGTAIVDAILDSIDRCRVVVFVLSTSFKRDGWCREAVLRAYSNRRHAIRSVILDDEIFDDIGDDNLFAHLTKTNSPLRLSDYDSKETFYEDLIARISES